MKEEHIKALIDKYKNGLTSVAEEKTLFDTIDESNTEVSDIGSYVKNKRIEVPANLNENLWAEFKEKITPKRTLPFWKLTIAASVVIVFSIFINNYQNRQNELEKAALLEEAKNMFVDVEKEFQNTVLFEDETLIVYTKTEK